MKHSTKALAILATMGLGLAALSGCASSAPGSAGGNVKLTLTTWGEFGYEDLIKQYQKENPGVTVEQRKAADANAARDATNTYLAAGTGLGDVIAVESSWLAQMMQYPDKWRPVSQDLSDRWLAWKSSAATDQNGVLRMYGVDAAPAGICFNKDMFAEAGLPTDRAAVATLLEGSWEHFFQVGADFTSKTGKPWTNAASAIGQAEIQGLELTFQDKDNKVVATTNPDVKAAYDAAVRQVGITANMATFGADWTKGLGQNSFATQVCPSWMLGVIKSSAPDSTSWDVADVFPGGGISWGGSYLAVPAQTTNPDAAEKLAAWLTAPEQQLAAFAKVGAFPSQVAALKAPELLSTSDAYFQNAPSGEIFSNRATAISVRTYNGPLSAQISSFFNDAINRVEAGSSNADDSWAQFESDVKSLG